MKAFKYQMGAWRLQQRRTDKPVALSRRVGACMWRRGASRRLDIASSGLRLCAGAVLLRGGSRHRGMQPLYCRCAAYRAQEISQHDAFLHVDQQLCISAWPKIQIQMA